MKRCPTCTRVYDGVDLRFCLDDGTELIDKRTERPAATTLVLPETQPHQPTITAAQAPAPLTNLIPPTVASAQERKRNLIIWIVIIALLVPFLGGAGLGVWAVFSKKKPLTWHLVLQVEPASGEQVSVVVPRVISVIESRLNAAGVPNFEVTHMSDSHAGDIQIDLPNLPDPDRIKQLISAQGKLELVHVISPPSPAPAQIFETEQQANASLSNSGAPAASRRVLPFSEREEPGSGRKKWVVVESPAIVDGGELRNASAVKAPVGESYDINFTLGSAGAGKFGQWTAANINEYLGVVLNDEVKSIAYIKSQIYDQGQISGRFTKQSAEDLALVLRTGALPARVKLIDERIDR